MKIEEPEFKDPELLIKEMNAYEQNRKIQEMVKDIGELSPEKRAEHDKMINKLQKEHGFPYDFGYEEEPQPDPKDILEKLKKESTLTVTGGQGQKTGDDQHTQGSNKHDEL